MKDDPRKIEHAKNRATKNIARAGTVAKRTSKPAPLHPGMNFRQQDTAGRGGLSHPVAGAPDASSANPLDPEPDPDRKSYKAVAISPGMRSRTNSVPPSDHAAQGIRVLAEGIAAESGKDHPVKIAMRNKGRK